MKTELINSIYKQNDTLSGIDKLYYSMQEDEKRCWDTIDINKTTNWTTIFSENSSKNPNKIVINEVDTNTTYTYQQLEQASNNIKNFILQNIEQYKIGVNYHNSFYFLATIIAINKANKLAVLFNNREPKNRLEDIATNNDIKVVFGNPIDGLLNYNIQDILKTSIALPEAKISPTKTSLDDPAFVIFTSGTSGPSKGALFSHRRMIGAGIAWSLRTAMDENDNCYIPLPLYHGNALAVAFSSVIYAKATATIRIKFSVSKFFDDINRYKCSHMVYIGELFRYILNTHKTNPNNYLKVIFGNGLNTTLWEETVKRYNIKHVVEHFGATEMPAGALTNWFNKTGYCGYLPIDDEKVKDMILQNGEALFLVPSSRYKGYLDSSLDESKLQRDVLKKGDVWWKSGDILEVNDEGFYTFKERVGDTFRYKGENISCVDIENIINQNNKFDEVIAYGIELKNIEGKIGMVSIVTSDKFDANLFYNSIENKLASYAMPYFIKIENTIHKTTTTLKIQKNILSSQNLSKYKTTPHYILINKRYTLLTEELYSKLEKGTLVL
ncbi:MAG: AMP-binding protein [Campylobacterota bacterium]|nr:AMP-binding protein [Campylobacterota bacterium]